MTVLYLKRSFCRRGLISQVGREVRRRLFFYEQEGYFEASLHEAFSDITYTTARDAYRRAEVYSREHELVVVNRKTDHLPDRNQAETLRMLGEAFDIPAVLLEIGADATQIPSDAVCDRYDLIFRRECLKDTDRYDLSAENQQKLRTTMLPCLYIPLPRYSFSSWFERFLIPQAPSGHEELDKQHDVFFCGQYSSQMPIRAKVVQVLKEHPEIDFHGGLQPKNEDVDVPEALRFPRLSPDEYVRALKQSRIVLALDGIGQFTFRHLEAWHFGGFLMSAPSIRGLDLPLSAQEGTHYISYDDTDDLIQKIRHYVEHPDERQKIADNGENMFASDYNPQKHGTYIYMQMEEIR